MARTVQDQEARTSIKHLGNYRPAINPEPVVKMLELLKDINGFMDHISIIFSSKLQKRQFEDVQPKRALSLYIYLTIMKI